MTSIASSSSSSSRRRQRRSRPPPIPSLPASSIKYVIDAESFFVRGEYLVKELGVLDVDTGAIESRYYRVGEFRELSERDQRQCAWLKTHVHGLRFEDRPTDEPQESVMDALRELGRSAAGRTIAYKGGVVERRMLDRLGLPAVNLEVYGCPRFDVIVDHWPDWYDRSLQCDRHIVRRPKLDVPRQRLTHCPRTELRCFHRWLVRFVLPADRTEI